MIIYLVHTKSGQALQGSFSTGWLAGKPNYPQKLKVPEGYEKINEKSNIGRSTDDGLIAGCIEAKFCKNSKTMRYINL